METVAETAAVLEMPEGKEEDEAGVAGKAAGAGAESVGRAIAGSGWAEAGRTETSKTAARSPRREILLRKCMVDRD